MAEVWVISLRLPGLPAVFTFLRMMKIPGARYTKQNFQDVRSLRRLALETFSLLRYFGSFRLVFLRLRRIVEETRTRSQREHTHTHTHTHTQTNNIQLSRARSSLTFCYFTWVGKWRCSCSVRIQSRVVVSIGLYFLGSFTLIPFTRSATR